MKISYICKKCGKLKTLEISRKQSEQVYKHRCQMYQEKLCPNCYSPAYVFLDEVLRLTALKIISLRGLSK